MNYIIINASYKPHIIICTGGNYATCFLPDNKSAGETLLYTIEEMLKEQKISIADIETVAVCIGPGSFTGTRVALATAFGLCFNNNKKIISFSNFDLFQDEKKPHAMLAHGESFYMKQKVKIEFVSKDIAAKLNFSNLDDVDICKNEIELVNKKIVNCEFDEIKNIKPVYVENSQAEKELKKQLDKIEMRKAKTGDESKIFEIESKVFSENVYSLSMICDEINKGETYVLLLNGQIVAYAIFNVVFKEAELLKIAVTERYWHLSLAQRLFNYAKETIKAKKYFLEVNKNNINAINLYIKLGFKQTGKRLKYYEYGDDAFLFTLEIN